jgi:hypothetical protein
MSKLDSWNSAREPASLFWFPERKTEVSEEENAKEGKEGEKNEKRRRCKMNGTGESRIRERVSLNKLPRGDFHLDLFLPHVAVLLLHRGFNSPEKAENATEEAKKMKKVT